MDFCLIFVQWFILLFLLLPISPNNAAAHEKPAAHEQHQQTARIPDLSIRISNKMCYLHVDDRKWSVLQVHRVQFDKDGLVAKLFATKPIYLVESIIPKKSEDFCYKFTVLAESSSVGKSADECAKNAMKKHTFVEHETPCQVQRESKADFHCVVSSTDKKVAATAEAAAAADTHQHQKQQEGKQQQQQHKLVKSPISSSSKKGGGGLNLGIFRDSQSLAGRPMPRCVFRERKEEEHGIWKWADATFWAFAVPQLKNKMFVMVGGGIHRVEMPGLTCQKIGYCLLQPQQCEFPMLHKATPHLSAAANSAANTQHENKLSGTKKRKQPVEETDESAHKKIAKT